MATVNVTDSAKNFLQKAWSRAKETFKVLDADLDIDTIKSPGPTQGHLYVKLDNVGFTVEVPGASLITTAAHAGNLGVLEQGD